MADWLAGVDLLDPEAVARAARPVMAAMTNPNGLDRANAARVAWLADVPDMDFADLCELELAVTNALERVGLDLMDGDDWRESATGVRS